MITWKRGISPALALASCAFLFHLLGNTQENPSTLKEKVKRVPPLSLDGGLKSFEVVGGFKLELLAAEPLVLDPVAGAYDEDGNLFVVEMSDYPNPLKEGEIPKGRLRKLIDKDGDGKFDEAQTLAEDLFWPTGVACWKGGAFVLSVPDIWYFKDTNQDGKADIKERVATGFIIYNVQQLANNLRWGIDNRIYGITAGNGADLVFQKKIPPLSLRRRDFKFDPESLSFEGISGTGQFGLAFDDWYRRFTCSNRDPVMEVILPSQAMDRNPYLTIPSAVAYEVNEGQGNPITVYPISPPEPWRQVRTERYLAEGQKFALSEMVANGVFTSASGITIYRGHAYPEGYKGQAFIANSAGNLVHRRALLPDGAGNIAIRSDLEKEFVRSRDIWFRPVNFINAPDGTLHILDMHREIVEHPWTIPDDIKDLLDLHSGRDRGRVYRLAPPGFTAPKPPRLANASSKELVDLLSHRGAWWRETAQRLLYERRDPDSFPLIHRMSGVSGNPLARLHALYLLDGLGVLKEEEIRQALIHPEPGLRQHGLVLAEKHLSKYPQLENAFLLLKEEQNPRVCFQLAIFLGAIKNPLAADIICRILEKNLSDRWIRLACLSSCSNFALPMMEKFITNEKFKTDPFGKEVLGQLFLNLGTGDDTQAEKAIARLAKEEHSISTMSYLQQVALGRKRVGKPLKPKNTALSTWIDNQIVLSLARAGDEKLSVEERVLAAGLLGFSDSPKAEKVLATLLQPGEFKEVQSAALKAMRNSGAPFVPSLLMDHWKSFTPALRTDALDTMLSRVNWTRFLLDGIKKGKISPTEVDLVKRQLLLKHRDSQIQAMSTELFGLRGDRKEVLSRYATAIKGGEFAKGKEVFQKECAVCHKIGAEGKDLGPNLLTVGTRTPDAFLTAILDPTREVDARYLNYIFALKGGKIVTGMITSESAKSISVVKGDATVETLSRDELEEMISTGKSFMPEGFEERITPKAMADLLAYLLAPR